MTSPVKRQKPPPARSLTVLIVAEAFIARGLKGKRKAEVVAYQLRKEVIPVWRDRFLSEISRHDVVDLIEKIAARPAPAFARNILDAIRAVFNWAVARRSTDWNTRRPTALSRRRYLARRSSGSAF